MDNFLLFGQTFQFQVAALVLSFEFVYLRWILERVKSFHQTQKLNKQLCPYQGLVCY